MKAIHADPKELRKIFADVYSIPDFQRPYSWEKEQCEKMWENLIDFYKEDETKKEKYFLGTIVVHGENSNFVVIDGQQRLTSLLLLIKAIHNRAVTFKALEVCLKTKNPLTEELTEQSRIQSEVISDDKKDLENIINGKLENVSDESKLKINYNFFNEKIDEILKYEFDSDKFNDFIITLLDRVVLLPIHCGSEDDSLIIFETINNTGMALSDADIFKAKLYQKSLQENKKEYFINEWSELENHLQLFRIYMHVVRAKEADISKEIALRTYFTKGQRLSNWKNVLDSLKILNELHHNWELDSKNSVLVNIMDMYPNQYWYYPLYVFLHKHGKIANNSKFEISLEYKEQYDQLVLKTLKYFYIKGVVHNSVNSVKDTVFKVCASIESGGDFLKYYDLNISELDIEEFRRKIESSQLGRYGRGLVMLCAYLNPNQDHNLLSEIYSSKFDIEHILPKAWNNYDKWTNDTWTKNINSLGNLVPIERKLNIKASNEFFNKKKKEYSKSKISDVNELTELDNWYPENLKKIQIEKINRILSFFNCKN